MRERFRSIAGGGATALALMLLLAAAPIAAQVFQSDPSDLARLAVTNRQLRVTQTLSDVREVRAARSLRAQFDRFRSENGAGWRLLVDERTGRANLLDGGALPFHPGTANELTWSDVDQKCRSAACLPAARLESAGRELLNRLRGLLQVDPEQFVLDRTGTIPAGDSLYYLRFQWMHEELPVEGASIQLTVNNGNLISVGVANVGAIRLEPQPSFAAEEAWRRVWEHVGGQTRYDKPLEQGRLVILPVTPAGLDPDADRVPFGRGLDYVLAYRLAFRRSGIPGTWEALVDAHSGELLLFRDANVYGHVKGGVYKTDAPQTEVSAPFRRVDCGATCCTDAQGDYGSVFGTSTMSGCAGSATVAGSVDIVDSCGAISLASNGVGLIDFGTSAGTDCTTPGSGGAGNTHAARTQYWNVAEIKAKAFTYLPTNTWVQAQLVNNVNLNQFCNAYWSPWAHDLNFFRTGTVASGIFGPYTQTCGNTGELPGVSLHEWGHGMDSNDGSGTGTDNYPLETRADWTATLQTHQSCTGGGFATARSPLPTYGLNCSGYGNPCSSCTGIRDADSALHTTPTAWTPQNKGTVWAPGTQCNFGSYFGPCGWEDHCESGIATQALWDFVNRDLVGPPTNLDLVTAWQLADRLFYSGMPASTAMYTCTGTTTKTSNGCGTGSLYTVMRAIDDDGDGTANGTPHAAAIFAALDRHGIACGAAGDTTNQNQSSCPALTTPTVTASATSHQVDLAWTSGGPSATRYFVLRNETGCAMGFTRIATVAAPSLTYTDGAVVPGATYYYRVQAATASDSCVSAVSACSTSTAELPAGQDFYVRDWTTSAAVHDDGAEPSTHAVFYHSSDVWNRASNSPGSPNANGWYDGDAAQAGTGSAGDNYAFVRVHRNATGTAETVTAHFLVSPFGTGSAYQDAAATADPVLSFAAGDTSQVLASGYAWHQDPTASIHACLAVQISTASDPYDPPGLLGATPGPADYRVIDDNNKAQRNLDVSHNTFAAPGLAFALIHNAALFPRDMVLRIESPAIDRLQNGSVEVVGGRSVELTQGGTVTLPAMQPGENRWIGIRHQEAGREPVPIQFLELDRGETVNGFTLLAEPVSLEVAMAENLRHHARVFRRLAAAFDIPAARAEAESVEKLAKARKLTTPKYLRDLTRRSSALDSILRPLSAKNDRGDAFGVSAALESLRAAAKDRLAERAVAEHGMLLSRIDALATMLQKANGDAADILQMVRWQEALYRTRPALARLRCSARTVQASQEFISSYVKLDGERYAALLRGAGDCLAETAKAFPEQREAFSRALAEMERAEADPAALEGAHRHFLLALQSAAGAIER